LKLKLKKDKANGGGKSAPARAAQGIVQKGNALRSIAGLALIIILAPVAAGFAYLLLLREPGIQNGQVEQVASSYAAQQATNIGRFLARLETRLQSAAQTPEVQSAINAGSKERIASLETSMLAFFPEAIALRVLPIGDLGTAEFSAADHNLNNHIELDMVRRASYGKEVPPEAYQVDDRWLSALVTQVKSPQSTHRSAVLLLTLDNKQLGNQMKYIEPSVGSFKLIQMHASRGGSKTKKTIAKSSKGGIEKSWSAEIPNSNWKVLFSPSEQLATDLQISSLPLFIVLGISLLAVVAAMTFMLTRFPSLIR
jgi:phosphomannomutase/phosphoglucomutase